MKSGRILTVEDHSRDGAGLTYIYPVVSRRAGGVSLGINLNPNNACNFRCVYCQVPNLTYGKAPAIDLELLEDELTAFLKDILHGEFMTRHVPAEARSLKDVAFSGNGEPTSVADFDAVVQRVITAMAAAEVAPAVKLRLITNGSLGHKGHVQRGLARMAARNGEVWFKLDAGDDETMVSINNFPGGISRHVNRLREVAGRCPTWIQTCMFARHGRPLSDVAVDRWINLLSAETEAGTPLEGVYLYGLARQSFQPEAATLSPLTASHLEDIAHRLTRASGLRVVVKT